MPKSPMLLYKPGDISTLRARDSYNNFLRVYQREKRSRSGDSFLNFARTPNSLEVKFTTASTACR